MSPPLFSKWPFIISLMVYAVRPAWAGMGTCSPTEKCETGCCSREGFCGFGPEFCGDEVCISSCDSVAECGKHATANNTECPLNVCCSQFGFCGTTPEFCDVGCQSGCDAVREPSCSGTSSEAVYIGYYEGWNSQHPCDVVLPEDINVSPWTHLYYSFAGISIIDFSITTTNPRDEDFWTRFTSLKKKKPSLKTYISVGGWDVGGAPFSIMVRFPGTRKHFIKSALNMMRKYGFDGIDIDWEYPAAEDRGGAHSDTANLVKFLKELRAALGSEYGLTVTLPTSYWYLKGFDIANMVQYVDFFNFMAYDIHGTWDGRTSKWTKSVVNPHTNLTEIAAGLDLLWRNKIDPSKVVLGLGFYGRSFQLANPSCSTPGCAFYTGHGSSGGALAGECSGTSGILSNYEISRIINSYDPTIEYDEAAAVNWMTWSSDQWVSFDNGRTLKQKAKFANNKCLGGLLSWAVDLGGPGSLKNPNLFTDSDLSMDGADPGGGSDGTGNLYVGAEVLNPDSNPVTAIAPVNIVFPISTLPSPTTIAPSGYPTSLEVAWPTTKTVTSGTITTVTSTITRYIQTTTIAVPSLTVREHGFYNWNITDKNTTHLVGALIPSIRLPPIVITDDPNPLKETSVSHTPAVTRTIHLPPWPWTTDGAKYPRITFTQGGPPGPTCTAGCGTLCTQFCDGPCLNNCGDTSSRDFISPLDDDPPTVAPCAGKDCKNGKCQGEICIEKGCTGADCQNRVCVGDDCKPTGCTGPDCDKGHCSGKNCQDHGCVGKDCDKQSGGCFGPLCLSWGCLGPQCSGTDFVCTGPHCRVVSCSGPSCKNGICTGPGCMTEDGDCEAKEAESCTEWISSTMMTPASTYSTQTVTTACKTISACNAKGTTVTKTIDEDGLVEGTVTYIENDVPTDAADDAIASSLASYYSSYWSAVDATSTSSTVSSTTTTTSSSGGGQTHDPIPNSLIILKEHIEDEHFDSSVSHYYKWYSVYYSYRHQVTEKGICALSGKVDGPVKSDEGEEYPTSLGPFALGQYTGCLYSGSKHRPGSVKCDNSELAFTCLGYKYNAHAADWNCGKTYTKDGTTHYSNYYKAVECLIL
ncbi:hypothetical protein BDV41DRAFT_400350 [Aspergillus transmontanensis]|uniref:chitinase n=1 Tax=Aspergillus transmontanensis TaxID=1034304 RepID=A0A5N6VNG7_9EURO|nr:hypothetical protein BDV41DRAFT_400350 [Aspergillus transmontanensis]